MRIARPRERECGVAYWHEVDVPTRPPFVRFRTKARHAANLPVGECEVIDPNVPAKSVPEFIAYAKANPRKLNMASAGTGTVGHIAGELFKIMAGIEMIHVPYRGGGAVMTDLLGGQVQVFFGSTSLTVEQVRAGKLRALAVTSARRWPGLPDVPTVGDFVPGYEATSLFGVGAIVDRLNREINAALEDPKLKTRLLELGGTLVPGSPADFGKLIADETERWAKVIRSANIKAE